MSFVSATPHCSLPDVLKQAGERTGELVNPNFGVVNYVTNNNRGTYNAMILSIRGNPNAHLNFQASYTLSTQWIFRKQTLASTRMVA